MHISITVPEKDSLLDDRAIAQLPALHNILGYKSPRQILVKRSIDPSVTTVGVFFEGRGDIILGRNYKWFTEQVVTYLKYFTTHEVRTTYEILPGT